MSFNRQEKRIALVVIGVLLVGGAVLACKRANPRVAEDLWVFGSDATGVRGESAEGDTRAEPQNEILAVHLERVEKRIDQGGGAPAERPGPARRRINLNTASEAELLLLDGIGPKRAQAIVRYRTEVGPFGCLEDVERVEGIGPRTVARMAPWICVELDNGPDRAK